MTGVHTGASENGSLDQTVKLDKRFIMMLQSLFVNIFHIEYTEELLALQETTLPQKLNC